MVDRATRWAEATPISGTSVRDCTEAFFRGWISRFGVLDQITSDRGAQFTSEVWASLCQRLGIKHLLTSAYHPQSNGLVERFHRQLKDFLRARLAGVQWVEHLPWALFGLRAQPKEDSNMSSAELVYGTPLTLPGEFLGTLEASAQEIADRIRSEVDSFNPLPVNQPLIADSSASVLEALQVATHVYVLQGGVIPTLAPRYQGPYLVLEKGPKSFRLAIGAREEVVSVDRLKPHTGDTPVTAAQPPRRGRPAADVKQLELQGLCALTPRTWAEIVRGGCGQPQ
jgi:hypothetical protein